MKKLLLLTTCLLGGLVAADTSALPSDTASKNTPSLSATHSPSFSSSASIALPSMPPIMEGAVHYQVTAAGLEISTPAATGYISYASAADTSRSLTDPIPEVLKVLPTPVISIIAEYIDIDQESLDFSNENYDDMIGLLEKCKRLLYLRLNIAALSDQQCFCLFKQLANGNKSLETIDFGGPLQWSLYTNKNLNQRFATFVSAMPNLVSYQVVHTPGLIFSPGKAFIQEEVEWHKRVTYVKRRK